jgi:uncharacterized protein with PIN domain
MKMTSCPDCKTEIKKQNKTWTYGKFDASFYVCPKCGARFRDYSKDGKFAYTLILRKGTYRKAR